MPLDIYDKIMMLAKRRGLIYPSFEIYGGSAGFYDYGPLGSILKLNLENLWRNSFLFWTWKFHYSIFTFYIKTV